MPGFVITSVFEVHGGKVPLGADVLARAWGKGHRFSYCDGRMLTLVVELSTSDARAAFETLLSRAETVWQFQTGEPLGPAMTLRVQGAVEPARVPAGIPAAGGDGPSGRVALAVKGLRSRRPPGGQGPTGGPGEEPPDDGGLAGVREPRRPRPGPPGLLAARDLPDAGDLPGAIGDLPGAIGDLPGAIGDLPDAVGM